MSAKSEFERLSGTFFLSGTHQKSDGPAAFRVNDPATGAELGFVAECTEAEIDQVFDAAKVAQKEWWAESALHRAEVMHEVARKIKDNRLELAELLTREMGKTFK